MPDILWAEQIKKYGACCANCRCRDECQSYSRDPHDDWICANWVLAKCRAVQMFLFDL